MGYSADDVLALALACVKLGGYALMYEGEANRSRTDGKWIPVPEAVASGQAFAVEPKASLLALDLDTEEVQDPDRVVAWLDDNEFRYVLTASGRDGNRHAWVNLRGFDKADVKGRLIAETGIKGGNIRATQATRPPLAPHRLGLPVALIAPVTVSEALVILGPPERSRRLSDPVYDLLINGGRAGEDRHRVIWRVACGCVHAGFTASEFTAIVLDTGSAAGAKYREEMTRERAVRELHNTFANAKRWVASNPVVSPRDHALAVRAEVEAHAWSGRTGGSDRAVMLALVEKACEVPTFAPAFSGRDLADYAQLSLTTVKAALRRLQEQGWIEKEPGSERWEATAYRIRKGSVVPKNGSLLMLLPQGVSGSVLRNHPLFRNGTGLGLRARELYESLDESLPRKTQDLRRRCSTELSVRLCL